MRPVWVESAPPIFHKERHTGTEPNILSRHARPPLDAATRRSHGPRRAAAQPGNRPAEPAYDAAPAAGIPAQPVRSKERSVMSVCKAMLLALGVLLAPAMANAQGSIAGSVKDSSGAVLPGVTVEAASPALIEKV